MKKNAATHRCNALVEAADWPALAVLRDELGAQGEEWAAEVLSRIDGAVALAGPAAPCAGVLGVPMGLADWEVVLEPPHYSLAGFSSGCIPSGFEEVAPLALPAASGSSTAGRAWALSANDYD